MKSTMITGLAAILLLAISCKKESALTTGNRSAPAVTSDINEAGNYAARNIHGQRWMTTNLAVTHYRNGDPIPQVRNKAKWAALTTGAWCWYNNDSATGAVYGKLYNWYAVHDPRGLAPMGWHIPSNAEWDTLQAHLGNKNGGKMKDTGTIEAGTGLWAAPNRAATNSSGFTALPGGSRDYYGTFSFHGYMGYWWSSTEYTIDFAWYRILDYRRAYLINGANQKQNGRSVRCIKD